MKEPREDVTTDGTEREGPPDFEALTPPEELVRGERTRDDFFDAVLGLDEPATIPEIATRAGHGEDAAREYLEWFERMGIAVQVTEHPTTYRCNRAYLHWRRVQKLREAYSVDELVSMLSEAVKADGEYAASFDAADPSDVSLSTHAASTDQPLETIWRRLSEWKTTRRRIELLERAISGGEGRSAGPEHSPA